MQGAVDALLGGHSQGDALLGVRIDGTLRAVDHGTDPAQGRQLGQLAETWLSLVTGTAPILTPMRQLPEQAQDGPPRRRLRCCSARSTLRTGRRATRRSA